VCLKTPNGIIVSTGDFRFDFVTAGDETDIVKLSKIGLREPDVLLCESTNALTPGFSISEKHVIEELRRIIFRTKGRIIITIFASNLYRIEEIISLAIMAKRKILILGRSMVNNVEASMRAKILNIDQS
jgi:ribonuclease J